MSDRKTRDSNPEHPSGNPLRLDHFVNEVFESTVEAAKDFSVIYRKNQIPQDKSGSKPKH